VQNRIKKSHGIIVDPIIITGIPRSGANIIASVLDCSGALSGYDVHDSLRRGESFINNRIRNNIVRPFFKGRKASISGLEPFPDIAICKRVAEMVAPIWRRRILTILEKQQSDPGQWFYKGSDACLVWPIWVKAFPEAKWIIVRRQTEDLVKACMNTGYMTGHTESSGWKLWIQHYLDRFSEIAKSATFVRHIWPERILQGKFDSLETLVHDVGLNWKGQKVHDSLAPILWTNGIYLMPIEMRGQ